MVSQKRVRPHLRKIQGTRKRVRVDGHLRQVDGRLRMNKR